MEKKSLSTAASEPDLQTLLLEVTRLLLEHGAKLPEGVWSLSEEAALTQALFDKIAPHLNADVCFNYRLVPGRDCLQLVLGVGIPEAQMPAAEQLLLGQAFCGTVAATRRPIAADADRIRTDPAGAFIRGMDVRAYACHPLFARDGSVLGTLSLASTRRSSFTEAEVSFLQTVCHFLAILWDRHRAEARLFESQQRLASVVNAAMDAILTVEASGRIVVFNAVAETVFGRSAQQVIGTNIEQFVSIDVSGRLKSAEPRTETASHGPVIIELQGRRADGTSCLLEASFVSHTVQEQPLLTLILRDVTEARRAEAERVELDRQLRQTQKLNALGTLARGIAHDVNNVLTAILANTDLAALDGAQGALVTESLSEVARSVRQGQDLVRRILSFSKPEQQQKQRTSLWGAVAEALRLVRASIPSGVELTQRFDPATPEVWADPTQLHQVLLNLITNACYAMRGHRGRLTITVGPCELVPEGPLVHPDLHPGSYAQLTVADTGAGIAPAVLEHIFEPFFTTKPDGEGTGLGLSVAYGIVRAHKGAITVQSELGQGTSFNVYLPAAEPAVVASSRTVQPQPRTSLLRAMVVDDEEIVAKAVEAHLKRLGFQACTFTDPTRALAEIRAGAEPLDLVVTDLRMPKLSGLELVREIRQLYPKVQVMLMFGSMTIDEEQKAKESGLKVLIEKPNVVGPVVQAAQQLLRDRAVS